MKGLRSIETPGNMINHSILLLVSGFQTMYIFVVALAAEDGNRVEARVLTAA